MHRAAVTDGPRPHALRHDAIHDSHELPRPKAVAGLHACGACRADACPHAHLDMPVREMHGPRAAASARPCARLGDESGTLPPSCPSVPASCPLPRPLIAPFFRHGSRAGARARRPRPGQRNDRAAGRSRASHGAGAREIARGRGARLPGVRSASCRSRRPGLCTHRTHRPVRGPARGLSLQRRADPLCDLLVVMGAGASERSSSCSPSIPVRAKRPRHLLTVAAVSSEALGDLAAGVPRMIFARATSACGNARDRTVDSSRARLLSSSPIGAARDIGGESRLRSEKVDAR